MHARNIQSLRQALGGSLRTSKHFLCGAREAPCLGKPVHRTAIADAVGNLAGRSALLGTNDGHSDLSESLVWERRNPVTGGVVAADAAIKSDRPAESWPSPLECEIIALCRRDLSAQQAPAAIRLVPALETSASGKFG
jgi:hypothetical protein